MIIRGLMQGELLPALNLIWEIYAEDIAPTQVPSGVVAFQNLIKYENIDFQIRQGAIAVFGAFDGAGCLCGVSGIDRSGTILFLCVKKERRMQGIGRMLMQKMYQYCAQVLIITRMTMEVVPPAVEAMKHLGMHSSSPVQDLGKGPFVFMDQMIPPVLIKPKSNKKKIFLIAGVLLLVFVLFLVLVAEWVYIAARNSSRSVYPEFEEQFSYEEDPGFLEDALDEETGIEGIPVYEQEDLGFEVTEENYFYFPTDTKTTYIDFEIYYPQISGLDQEVQDRVNEELKSCAMETVDRIYENPDVELKERVLGEEYPVIADYVRYKVTYLSEDMISVIFEDYSFEGNEESSYVGIRAKNINLKDGTVYQLQEVLDINDRFTEEWLDHMREEADEENFLAELDIKELESILTGEKSKGDIYEPVFFADRDGIQIGLSLRYPEGDENDIGYGWVTVALDDRDLSGYQMDHPFWELLK